MKTWIDGELVDNENCLVSVLSHTLHYGTGVFEGIRAYRAGEHVIVFRLMDHLARLEQSANAMGFELKYSEDELREAVIKVLCSNNLRDAYIRPLIFVGPGSLSLSWQSGNNELCTMVAAWKWDSYFDSDCISGISVATGVGRRLISQSGLHQAKVVGTYVNGYAATMAAKAVGADEALLIDEDGCIAEATAANIFMVREGKLCTPTCRAALAGITRDTIVHLARPLGFNVCENDLVVEDLYGADEVFLTGTACEVVPVTKVDGQLVGDGRVGPITQRLYAAYQRAVHSAYSFTSNVIVNRESIAA